MGGKEVDLGRAEARGDIGAGGAFIDLPRRAELEKLAVPDHADPGGHGHGLDLVVGHVENGRAKLELDPLELETKLRAKLRIQRGERLVHQVDRGIADQRAANGHPLHLAAGQAGGTVVQLARDVQQLRGLFDALADDGLGHASRRRAQRERQIVIDREVRIQRILLEDKGDIARSRRIMRDVAAVDHDRAVIGALEPGDQPQRRGLAGTARPEQDQEFPVVDRQRELAYRLDSAEALGDVAQDDVSHGAHSPHWRSGSPGRCRHRTAPAVRNGIRAPRSRRSALRRLRAAAPRRDHARCRR